MNFKKINSILLGLPKTIIINFKCLPFKQAVKLPIFVSHKTKFYSLKGKIFIKSPVTTGMIKIGLNGSGTLRYQSTILELNGNITCEGNLNIGGGSEIVTVNEESKISFGKNVNFSGGIKLISRKSITFGENNLVSWDTQIMDSDLHYIYQKGTIINEDREIIIKDNVWIGSGCSILKGCTINENNIIASGSMVLSDVDGNNQIVGGSPLRTLKNNVYWKL